MHREGNACTGTDVDGVNVVFTIDSKIHGCDGWKTASRSSFKTESRPILRGHGKPKSSEKRGGGRNLVLLDVEFCPPPMTPLSVILSSKQR